MKPGLDRDLKEEVLELLRGPHAHLSFEDAVEGFPAPLRGARVPGVPHTAWELLEHMRLAQEDILGYCRNPEHPALDFPDDYWPPSSTPPEAGAWGRSVAAFLRDRADLESWVSDPDRDLLAAVPDEEGPTLFHELAIVAAHTSYHLGQLFQIRRALGA